MPFRIECEDSLCECGCFVSWPEWAGIHMLQNGIAENVLLLRIEPGGLFCLYGYQVFPDTGRFRISLCLEKQHHELDTVFTDEIMATPSEGPSCWKWWKNVFITVGYSLRLSGIDMAEIRATETSDKTMDAFLLDLTAVVRGFRSPMDDFGFPFQRFFLSCNDPAYDCLPLRYTLQQVFNVPKVETLALPAVPKGWSSGEVMSYYSVSPDILRKGLCLNTLLTVEDLMDMSDGVMVLVPMDSDGAEGEVLPGIRFADAGVMTGDVDFASGDLLFKIVRVQVFSNGFGEVFLDINGKGMIKVSMDETRVVTL